MKKRVVAGVLAGLLAGAGLTAAVVGSAAPRMMLAERASPHGLDQTVARLVDVATNSGWVVSSVMKLDESIRRHGGGEVRPVRLVNLCQARHAARILSEDDARIVSVMMPCTVAVYEKADGSVHVGAMRPAVLGRVFGGVVSEVMAGPVAADQARFIDAALAAGGGEGS